MLPYASTLPWCFGRMTVVGNVLRAGPSTPTEHLAFMMIGGAGDVEYYGRDNIAVDQVGEPLRMFGRYTTSPAKIIQVKKPPFWPARAGPTSSCWNANNSPPAPHGTQPV